MEELTNEQKAHIFNKLVTHAETIQKGKWIEGAFLTQKVKEEVESHAIAFLKVVKDEIKKLKDTPSSP